MPQDYRAQVFKAIDYISLNLCFNPTLEEIASAVALSSFHFHRIFKAEVGETIAGFTRRLRMEKAAMWLIESPRRDITGLALRVGFSSSQNFAKAFRQHFSVSPGEYRRLHAASVKSKPGNVTGEKSAYSQTEAMKVVRADPDFLAAGVLSLPARRVAYMRRFGPYGKETCWLTHHDLAASFPCGTPRQPAGMVCIYWDAPEVTLGSRCRTDVCIELSEGERPGRGVAVQTIAGGSYAVCKFAVFGERLDAAWEIAFAWIKARGLMKGDLPCYEKYYNETDVALDYYVFDIFIPVKKHHKNNASQ
ncbi:AraC family transcriptional regulator [Raoultella terrigena]|uniref:AraC family transcriptional regulator n=1 Tax=Raoultella terrigena TaxID=577 RepID=UPI0015B7EF84|nr:AraC family transcriptional regulator [Raoultella terrigena]NWK90160.1 AraC family transcriptional regulator [Raoultella terrigena]